MVFLRLETSHNFSRDGSVSARSTWATASTQLGLHLPCITNTFFGHVQFALHWAGSLQSSKYGHATRWNSGLTARSQATEVAVHIGVAVHLLAMVQPRHGGPCGARRALSNERGFPS